MAKIIKYHEYTIHLHNIICVIINGKNYHVDDYKKSYMKNDRISDFYKLIKNNRKNITYCLSNHYGYDNVPYKFWACKYIKYNTNNVLSGMINLSYLELYLEKCELHNLSGPAVKNNIYNLYSICGQLINYESFKHHELVIRERREIKLKRILE